MFTVCAFTSCTKRWHETKMKVDDLVQNTWIVGVVRITQNCKRDSIQQWFFVSTTQNHRQVLKLQILLEQMMNCTAHCLETNLISWRCLILQSVYQLIVTKFVRYIVFSFKLHICYKLYNSLAFYRMTSRRNVKN